jgi:FG-GAP repeat
MDRATESRSERIRRGVTEPCGSAEAFMRVSSVLGAAGLAWMAAACSSEAPVEHPMMHTEPLSWAVQNAFDDPPAAPVDLFGWAIAVSGDTAIVSALEVGGLVAGTNHGAVYV